MQQRAPGWDSSLSKNKEPQSQLSHHNSLELQNNRNSILNLKDYHFKTVLLFITFYSKSR